MPTIRGWAAFGAGVTMWIAARLVGSADLHMVAVGITALPFIAILFVRWSRVRLDVRRHLSSVRVFPGTRLRVSLTIENRGRAAAPFLLLEDGVPGALGKPARLVVTGVPPRNEQTVAYDLLCRHRGRYTVGPLAIFVGDPFGLARVRVQLEEESELIVYPEVEEIEAGNFATQGAGAGDSAVRHLFRSAAEFYTMREYVTGDDLRRIHWPSVARTGHLMIRQDESTRRSAATLLLDNRAVALGGHGSPGFERAVSAAATVGRALVRSGFSVRLATVDAPWQNVTEDRLLETLAGATPTRTKSIGESLRTLRETALADTTLVFVSAPPLPSEVGALSRAGAAFGRKLAVFVYPVSPSSLGATERGELESRASAARTSLQRAGWNVSLLDPEGRLAEVWAHRRTKKVQPAGLYS